MHNLKKTTKLIPLKQKTLKKIKLMQLRIFSIVSDLPEKNVQILTKIVSTFYYGDANLKAKEYHPK